MAKICSYINKTDLGMGGLTLSRFMLLLFIGVFVFGLQSCASTTKEGFDRPSSEKTTDLGRSENMISPPGNIKEICEIYPSFAVISVEDPGIMGAESIQVRHRSKGMTDEELCKKGGEKFSDVGKIKSGGYFWGVSEHFLFIALPDSFGGLRDFEVFDVKSAKKIFTSVYNENEIFSVKKDSKNVSIRYYTPLKVSCLPVDAGEDKSCWGKIMIENGIAENIKLQRPSCEMAIKQYPEAIISPGALQVTAEVYIKNISDPKIEFVGGKTTCQLAP